MKKFTAVLRRAGLQADQSLVTTESLHAIVAETSVPFPITPAYVGGPALGRILRIWVEDDELRGEGELDDVSEESPVPQRIGGADVEECTPGCPCYLHP
jgi:hypothetical protein